MEANSPLEALSYGSLLFDTPEVNCGGFFQVIWIELGVREKKKKEGPGGCPSKFSRKNEYPSGLNANSPSKSPLGLSSLSLDAS